MPAGAHLRVHAGDYVKAGDPLVVGPLVPHDILRISGIEAVQEYLVREVQSVYRSQRVDIDDKHIEIIVVQMLRKVKVEQTGRHRPAARLGDGQVRVPRGERPAGRTMREGQEPRRFALRGRQDRHPGGLRGRAGPARGRGQGSCRRSTPPHPATCSTVLLGITKAAVQSDSFISAASFQETTKVLTEAALAGKVDYLVGLKENVILGHLIPAGTGFRTYQDSEVRINAPALSTTEDLLADEPADERRRGRRRREMP